MTHKMPRKPIKRHRNLLRRDHIASRTHGWLARVQRRHANLTRMFSDGKYGGYRQSLFAAMVWRAAVLDKLHNHRYTLWRRNKKRKNNSSGIVGVGRYRVQARLREPRWY